MVLKLGGRKQSELGGTTSRHTKIGCTIYNSGGDIVGGFWLRKIPYEQVDESTRWLIALYSRLVEKFTTSQCLTLAYNILLPYKEWAHTHGLDRRRGTALAQQVIDSGELPPKRIIN